MSKSNEDLQNLKGFRDFLPSEMKIRKYVLGVLKDVFTSYGYEPLKTPSLEYAETLLGKYGEETDKLVYQFTDQGNRQVALPYDLTVPTAKILSMYQAEIQMPFKRYQIQRIWRAEKPQKGRYREVLQCDIDIFGIENQLADAEIITVIYQVFSKLDIPNFKIFINSRPALFKMLSKLGIEQNKWSTTLQTLDKIDRKTKSEVEKELVEKGYTKSKSTKILKEWKALSPQENDPKLKTLETYLQALGVPKEIYEFTPTLVRGLDYYTGPIFETKVTEPDFGSVTGGGRYDNLVEKLGGPKTPAVGTTIGLDRICDVIKKLNLLEGKVKPSVDLLLTIFNPDLLEKTINIAQEIRSQGFSTELFLDPNTDLRDQLAYASRKEIPYVGIIGPQEAKEEKITLKNMQTGEQTLVSTKNIGKTLES
ncbi:MAG: histidine--tRNA ligase [Patescibacteria group bacterium]|nr:histidine--tRNA ligase [Patescibacteria group bacterium]